MPWQNLGLMHQFSKSGEFDTGYEVNIWEEANWDTSERCGDCV